MSRAGGLPFIGPDSSTLLTIVNVRITTKLRFNVYIRMKLRCRTPVSSVYEQPETRAPALIIVIRGMTEATLVSILVSLILLAAIRLVAGKRLPKGEDLNPSHKFESVLVGNSFDLSNRRTSTAWPSGAFDLRQPYRHALSSRVGDICRVGEKIR
jgi:hypothetical protein